MPFHYAGIVQEFPSAPRDSFMVANLRYLQSVDHAGGPNVVFAKAGDPRAAARAIAKATRTDGTSVRSISEQLPQTASAITSVDLHGISQIEGAFTIALAAAAMAPFFALEVIERRHEFATMAALGATLPRIGAFVWSEAALVLVGSLLLAAVLGMLMAMMLIASCSTCSTLHPTISRSVEDLAARLVAAAIRQRPGRRNRGAAPAAPAPSAHCCASSRTTRCIPRPPTMRPSTATGAGNGPTRRRRPETPYEARSLRLTGEGEQQRSAPRRHAPANVLVVDDEPRVIEFVRRGLQAEGFSVSVEYDGRRGEEHALRETVDVVVLDWTLPERDGMDVLATLREAKPEVPVILITSSGETKDGIAGLEAGAVDYLVKPFSVIELAARIRARLRRVAPRVATSLKREDLELDLLDAHCAPRPSGASRPYRDGVRIALAPDAKQRSSSAATSCSESCGETSPIRRTTSSMCTSAISRHKLGDAADPAPIHTVYAVGYRFGKETG